MTSAKVAIPAIVASVVTHDSIFSGVGNLILSMLPG